jgi:hypothetical protein
MALRLRPELEEEREPLRSPPDREGVRLAIVEADPETTNKMRRRKKNDEAREAWK